MTEFFGKYRGTVEGNADGQNRGRIQVSVPAVLGAGRMSWAEPCVPYAGKDVGFYAIPPEGANVWVEFEGGNPNFPIWSGCFWAEGQLPLTPDTKLLRTGAVKLEINDTGDAKGLAIEVEMSSDKTLKLLLNQDGITLQNGQQTVKLTSSNVSVNDGALEVT